MAVVWTVVNVVLWLFFVALIGRIVIEWVQVFSRDWRPRGPMLVIAEALFTVTDPPVKAVRRAVPPVRIGAASIDVSILLLFLAISLLMNLTAALAV